MTAVRTYLRELWVRRSLVRVLAARELKRQYEMNIVGFAWWLLEPLSLTLVYVVLVQFILRKGTPAYPVFILSGILPWKWLSASVIGSMSIVRGNSNLITDVYFPRALLPPVEIVTEFANFAVGLLIVPIFVSIYHVGWSWHLLWLPVIIAVQFLVVLALAYPLSVWGLYYRNLIGLTQNLLRLWFYLTPIIWSLDLVKKHIPKFLPIVKLNPATGLVTSYRAVILEHRSPDVTLAYAAAFGVIVLALGSWYFVRREQQFGKLV